MQRVSSIGARRHQIVEAQVDAAYPPPSLLPCPDGAIGVGVVRRLPGVIEDRVVRQANFGAAQHDAHHEVVDAQADAANDAPPLTPCPDRAIRDRVDVVRGLPRMIHDLVVRFTDSRAAQHDARVRRRHNE